MTSSKAFDYLQAKITNTDQLINRIFDWLPLISTKGRSWWARECINGINLLLFLPFLILPLMFLILLELVLLGVYSDVLRERGSRERTGGTFITNLMRRAEVSEKVSTGGRKGGSASAESRSQTANERNQKILTDAEKLLSNGRGHHELAGILAKRYAGVDGYPKSTAQYRNILKPLRENKNEN